MNTCMLAHTQHQFLVFANKTTLAVAGACGHVSAQWVCTRASHHVSACILLSCDMQRTLISFGDICGSACHCICGYTLTIPPPHTLPYYTRIKHPSCPLSQLKTNGGGLPPSERDSKTYDWRAAVPTFFVCVLIAACTMAHQDLTPDLAPSRHPCIQPHFTPTSSPPTPLHLIAISILAMNSLSRAHTWACHNRR